MKETSRTNLFRRKNFMKRNSPYKLLLEAAVYITLGTSLTLFLNSIPNKIIFKDFTKEIWIGLSEGIILLFDSLILIAKASSVLALILLSFLLLIGGTIRFIKFIKLISSHRGKRRNSSIYKSYRQ